METTNSRPAADIVGSLTHRYPSLTVCSNDIETAISLLCTSFKSSGKLMVCGNGGSGADSEHVVSELMKSFKFKRSIDKDFSERYSQLFGESAPAWLEGSLPAISLVSQTALSTAFSNDESAVGTFAQQVYGYGNVGDVLLAISTSGKSENVIYAAKVAKTLQMKIIALTGSAESQISLIADAAIRVPADETYLVQEYHLPVYHALCAAVEAELFENNYE